jgi:hypothetical protein
MCISTTFLITGTFPQQVLWALNLTLSVSRSRFCHQRLDIRSLPYTRCTLEVGSILLWGGSFFPLPG